MSVRVMSNVWTNYSGVGGSELLALLALADWSDDHGRCWPSMNAIAGKIRLSRSQAQRVVHGLIQNGFLRVVGNDVGGKPGSTRRYQINMEVMTVRKYATGCADVAGIADAQDAPHRCDGRGIADATQTIIEPPMDPSKNTEGRGRRTSANWVAILKGKNVSHDIAEAWLDVRKTKRLAMSEIALAGVEREAAKAGVTLQAALTKAIERGWGGFEASWLDHNPSSPARHADDFENKAYGKGGRM